MKKLASIILAVVMALTVVCAAAYADEVPQPEGGKKFESNWAIFGVTVQIVYEEEGYRVLITSWDPTELKGTEWEYSCFYNEKKDVLESVSSMKHAFAQNPDTGDYTYEPAEYDGFDDENTATVFSINENGSLIWTDGHGEDGFDLEFTDIGNFVGLWRSEDGRIWALIEWDDSEENYGYFVFVHDGDDDYYTDHAMHGLYNPETRKLETAGTETVTRKNEDGSYVQEYSDDPKELIISDLGGGKILLEAGDGVELIYDMDTQLDFDLFGASVKEANIADVKPEDETIEMKIRFVNASGVEITKITLRERIGSLNQEWILEALPDGGEGELTFWPVLKDGAPELDFLFNNGETIHGTVIVDKGDKTITFRLDTDGSVFADIVNNEM